MLVPAMRTYYALKSLDELYQAIWRTAVRNDRPVEAVIALPDEHWLATLYRTVMPDAVVVGAWKEIQEEVNTTVGGEETTVKWTWEQDERMYCTGGALPRLIALRPGKQVAKSDLPKHFGFSGSRAWEKNKGTIMDLLDDFYEEGSTNRKLRRKGML